MNCRMGCLLAVRGLTPRQLLPQLVVLVQTMQDQLPGLLQLFKVKAYVICMGQTEIDERTSGEV